MNLDMAMTTFLWGRFPRRLVKRRQAAKRSAPTSAPGTAAARARRRGLKSSFADGERPLLTMRRTAWSRPSELHASPASEVFLGGERAEA